MKVSLIIPFNKGMHFLSDCLLSVSEQSFTDYEVLLAYAPIEAEEQEAFDALVKQYEKSMDMKLVPVGAMGVAKARNKALSEASGEYIYFLDGDDYLEKDTLKLQLEVLEKDRSLDYTWAPWHRTWNQFRVYQELKQDLDMDNLPNNRKSELRDSLMTTEEVAEEFRLFLHPSFYSTKGKEQDSKRCIAHIMLCRKGGIKNVSCLGIMIRKDFIDKHKLCFDEDCYLYEDLVFVVRFLDAGAVGKKVNDAIYVKHRHNDPVNYPSVNQIKDDDRFEYFVKAFEKAREVISPKGEVRFYLDEIMLNYYCRYYITRVRRSENDYWRKERFAVMHGLISKCDKAILKYYKGNEQRMIKAALNQDIKLAKSCANRMLAVKKLINIVTNSHTFPRYLYYNYFTKKPVLKNTILFESFFGKSYSDSPKYIYEYILKHYPGQYNCVWSVDNMGVKVPYGAKRVKRYSIAYMYYLARAKYQVFNVRQPLGYRKNEETVFLECWHGTPLKRLVFDQEEVVSADPKYKSRFYKHVLDWDYLISPNPFSTEKFQSAFRIEKEHIVTCGYPRNDILYTKNNEQEIARLKEKMGIPKDKKVILYAPTWRDDDYVESGKYNFKLQLDLQEMKERLSDEYVVVLRMHYYIASNMDISDFKGFAYDESSYNDITELYLISDILITDYSSVFFDYGNLKRPVLFFTYDLEKYRDMLRGFYLDIEQDVPGPLLYTSDEVIDAIERIEEINAQYKERYDSFYERFCSVDDGHAAERICKKVFGEADK